MDGIQLLDQLSAICLLPTAASDNVLSRSLKDARESILKLMVNIDIASRVSNYSLLSLLGHAMLCHVLSCLITPYQPSFDNTTLSNLSHLNITYVISFNSMMLRTNAPPPYTTQFRAYHLTLSNPACRYRTVPYPTLHHLT